MSGRPKFYITTAISYPNGQPHIGHAYEAIATDAIARFERLDGKDVYFLTGTDEHGLKMKQTAAKEGLTPRELADRNAKRFREMAGLLELSNDDFIRTTEPRHYRASEEIWRRMQAAGDIFLKKYAGWYSVRDEAYYNESETGSRRGQRASRPAGHAGRVDGGGDLLLQAVRLSGPAAGALRRQSRFHPAARAAQRGDELRARRAGGSVDLALDARLGHSGARAQARDGKNLPPHVMYVWVDALTNYITGVGYPDEQSDLWHFWPADVHVIGKDILRFHAVYWPAFLMSAGLELPKRVFSHGFVLSKGEKMSKSVGNVVDPFDLVHAYGVEQVRYFFLREVNFGQDGNYSPEAIANRINADLANDLGNLAQRSLSMINKNCGARRPRARRVHRRRQGDPRRRRRALCQGARGDGPAGDHQVPRRGVGGGGGRQPLLRGRGAVGEEEDRPQAHGDDPLRDGRGRAPGRHPGAPVTPHAATKLLDLLGQDEDAHTFTALGAGGRLKPGTVLPEPAGVFPRYVAPEAEAGEAPAPKPPEARSRRRTLRRRTRPRKAPSVMLVDHHCHLDFPQLVADREGILARAQGGGRRRHGDHLDAHPPARRCCSTSPTRTTTSTARSARTRTTPTRSAASRPTRSCGCREHPKVVAIGEAGLDYFYKHGSPEAQAEGFRRHIEAARRTGLPLEIHTRDADDDTLAILEDEHAKGAFPAILHCYTGGPKLAVRAVELGLLRVVHRRRHASRRSDALRDIARDVPLDRLLVETDAPFLAPEPYRGKTNEPVVRRAHGGDAGRGEGRLGGRVGRGDDRQLLPPVPQGEAARAARDTAAA